MTGHQQQAPSTGWIRRATMADAEVLAQVVANAFHHLEVSSWLVDNPSERRPVLAAQFGILIEHAILHGTVETTVDRTAAAVWLPSPGPDIEDYDLRLARACGRYTDRFRALDLAMHAAHLPEPAHDHLALLAVDPAWQRVGLGRALLRSRHRALDLVARPAYLEASSPHSRAMYLRHGYWPCGEPFAPPGCGALMWPMWRMPNC